VGLLWDESDWEDWNPDFRTCELPHCRKKTRHLNRRPAEGLTSEWASALLENELCNIILSYEDILVKLLDGVEETAEVLLFVPANQHQSMFIRLSTGDKNRTILTWNGRMCIGTIRPVRELSLSYGPNR
jgi:hypothetical protein